ncbi:MAG: TonB-dependent receptor, partial [Verrucomicrobia bacterium]|nr:TonB-dependent receptor [Verrucomicrobiota bacterium]
MNTKNPIALYFGWIAMTLAPLHAAHAADVSLAAAANQPTATIIGQVSNAATDANLEGAIVLLDGTGFSTRTRRDGAYSLQVPPGRYTLTVSYSGLDAQSVPLSLQAGATEKRDVRLTADIYKLAPFTVSGEREGNALANTLQRLAPNVKNIVSADAFGNMAGNPAELLTRLPGVVGDATGIETRYLTVRGVDPTMTAVTVDGNRMANGASAGSSREFQFELIGSDRVERIELTKSPTPDMDADSIAGVVNLVSKSAFDRVGRRINFTFGGIIRLLDDRDELRRNWTLGYSEVFAGKLGVSLNYGHRQTLLPLDVTNQSFEAVEKPAQYTYSYNFQNFRIKRTRWGGGLKLDYKWSDNTRFYFNGQKFLHMEHGDEPQTGLFSTAQTVATRDANGNLTGTGAILPEYTRNVTEWRPVPASQVTISNGSTQKGGVTHQYQLGAVHQYKSLEIDYDIFKSNSFTNYPGNANFQYTTTGIGFRIERKDAPFFPEVRQTAGPDIRDINNYRDNVFNIRVFRGDDDYLGGAFNLKKKFETAAPTWIKAGIRVREQTRELTEPATRWRFAGPDGVLNSGDENLRQFLNPDVKSRAPVTLPIPAFPFRDARTVPYNYPVKTSSFGYSGYNIGTALFEKPQQFVEDIVFNVTSELNNAQDFTEKISAGYVMGNVDIGKLSILGGLRVEETKAEGNGALRQITPAEAARRAAWVGPVTNDELRRRTAAEYAQRISASGKYKKVFPGLHLKYEAMPGLIARLSYATNIGRAPIGSLIPRTAVDDTNKTVSTSNPGLKPQFSDNFDLGLEYYFEPVGRVSAGVFLKEIKDFQFSVGGQTVGTGADNGFNGNYQGYALTTRANGGAARVKGLEAAYQQQFTFLPGWLNGFGAFANYTRLEADG